MCKVCLWVGGNCCFEIDSFFLCVWVVVMTSWWPWCWAAAVVLSAQPFILSSWCVDPALFEPDNQRRGGSHDNRQPGGGKGGGVLRGLLGVSWLRCSSDPLCSTDWTGRIVAAPVGEPHWKPTGKAPPTPPTTSSVCSHWFPAAFHSSLQSRQADASVVLFSAQIHQALLLRC